MEAQEEFTGQCDARPLHNLSHTIEKAAKHKTYTMGKHMSLGDLGVEITGQGDAIYVSE